MKYFFIVDYPFILGDNAIVMLYFFIRLRQNTLQLAAGMNGEANRVEARQSEDGLATTQFR